MAWRERSFSESVFNSTRMQPRVSNAWRSSRYFASVLTAVRCHGRPIQVHPISTRRCARSMLPYRVLPTARPASFATMANGSAVPAACAASASSIYARISSAVRIWELVQRQSSSSRPTSHNWG